MLMKCLFWLSAITLPLVINYAIKRHYKKKKQCVVEKYVVNNYYYHCIFLTMENIACRQHIFDNGSCGLNCSNNHLQTIVKFIGSAKTSISMCMYHLTLRQITDELINARDRGVEIRIITDRVTSEINHSKFKLLKRKFGFDIRVPPYNDSFMHHKFCLIDSEDATLAKMFLGSLNLTLQGFVANFEFVVLTNNHEMIRKYQEEFNNLWEDFIQQE